MAETAWRESTSRVLGAPLNHTFMYRQGQAYPAGLGACLRETLASEHGAPSFLAYALDAYADSGRKQYSEFELMGAFLWAPPRRGGVPARKGFPILQRRSWSGLNEQTALLFECVLGTRPTAAGSEWTGLGWRDNEVFERRAATVRASSRSSTSTVPLAARRAAGARDVDGLPRGLAL